MPAEISMADYQKILDFAYLNSFDEAYHRNVLSLMKTHFGGNLAVYTKWGPDDRLASWDSIGLSSDFILQIHQRYLVDQIRRRVIESRASNNWTGMFYSQDADLSRIIDSAALDFLHENHIYYFSIMFLSIEPREHYVLCKTAKEGPFSDREKEILQRIQIIISGNVAQRLELQNAKKTIALLDSHFDRQETGLILINEHQHVLNYNDAVFDLFPRRLMLTQIDEIVSWLVRLFDSVEEQATSQDVEIRRINHHGRCFTLEEILAPEDGKTQARFRLLTISRNRVYDKKLNPRASARYELSMRETQIADLLVSGCANQEIAEELHISLSTVKIHISNIFRKLSVHTRVDAIDKLTGPVSWKRITS